MAGKKKKGAAKPKKGAKKGAAKGTKQASPGQPRPDAAQAALAALEQNVFMHDLLVHSLLRLMLEKQLISEEELQKKVNEVAREYQKASCGCGDDKCKH